jgi:hypothetical protein
MNRRKQGTDHSQNSEIKDPEGRVTRQKHQVATYIQRKKL